MPNDKMPNNATPENALGKPITSERWRHFNRLIYTESNGDIRVMRARATHFGHSADDQDNGIGKWGWPTSLYDDFPGVALPFKILTSTLFRNSPLPSLRAFQPVRVYSHTTRKVAWCQLIDLGPHPSTGNHIDLTLGALKLLGLDPSVGNYIVDYRIALYKK